MSKRKEVNLDRDQHMETGTKYTADGCFKRTSLLRIIPDLSKEESEKASKKIELELPPGVVLNTKPKDWLFLCFFQAVGEVHCSNLPGDLIKVWKDYAKEKEREVDSLRSHQQGLEREVDLWVRYAQRVGEEDRWRRYAQELEKVQEELRKEKQKKEDFHSLIQSNEQDTPSPEIR